MISSMISAKMKLEQAVVILVSCLVEVNVGADDKTQVKSTIELTSSIDKSGRLAVCHNETIVYRCWTTITPTQSVLTWNVNINRQAIHVLFTANDSHRLNDDHGGFFAYLQNNGAMDNYLLSYLVIPYNPEWNGTLVQCMNGLISKDLPYTVTGSPTPPSSVWHTVTQDYVNLSWNTTSDTDCSMVMITVGDYNFLNASHQVGTATLDISEYHSNDSIVIEMYGINKCGMKSNRSTKETVKLSAATDGNQSRSKDVTEVGSITGFFCLLLGLFIGAILSYCYAKYHQSSTGSTAGQAAPNIIELSHTGSGEKPTGGAENVP